MFMIGERDVLLKFIELTGKDWEENERPEDIRLDPEKVDALLSVRSLVANPQNDLDTSTLRERCPAFCSVYREVMLRDVEELIPNGPANP